MKNKGITLIAVVVTVIVMTLLAVVSLNMSIGENGIVTRSVNSKKDEVIKQAHDEIQSGLKRYEYYDSNNADIGINVKLMSTENLLTFKNKFKSYLDGKVAYVGKLDDKLVIIHSNDNGVYTSYVDSQGNIETKAGIIVPKDANIDFSQLKPGTYDIMLEGDDSNNIVINIDSDYEDYISTDFGRIMIKKELPQNVKISIYKGTDKWSDNNLIDEKEDNTGDSLKPTTYTYEDGSVNTSKFKEEVRLGSDNVYAGYCVENGVWKLCVYTKGNGEGKMFKGLSEKDENYKRITFSDTSIYSKVQQIDILDGVTTVTRAAFWNFFDAKVLTVGKDITVFGSLFFKPDDLYEIYPENMDSARDKEKESSIETLYWNVKRCTFTNMEYISHDGHIYKTVQLFGSGNFAKANRESKIKNLYFGSEVELFPEYVLPSTNITKFDWPESVTEIDEYAFARTKFEESPIPLDYTGTIGKGTFWMADSLKTLELPYACEKVPESICLFCESLETIVLHDNIKIIETQAFMDCKKLESVVFPNKLLQIGEKAFADCDNLKSVDFHACDDSLLLLGDSSFINCDIRDLYLPTALISAGKYSFYNNPNLKNVYYNCQFMATSGAETVWYGKMQKVGDVTIIVSPIETITIGPNVNIIPANVFWFCDKVTSLTIPSNVKTMEDQAFAACTNLKNVTIEPGIETIGNIVFKDTAIESINVPNSIKSLGYAAFSSMRHLKNVYWDVPNPTIEEVPVDGYLFLCSKDGSRDNKVENVTFGPNVQVIPKGLFYGHAGLKEVIFSDSIYRIEEKAFYGCYQLENIELGNGVQYIGFQAFALCIAATNRLVIPSNCSEIGEQAFYYCQELTGIELKNGVEHIRADAFYGCMSCTGDLIIPASVQSIGYCAFSYVTGDKLICQSTTGYYLTGRNKGTGNNYPAFTFSQFTEVEVVDGATGVQKYMFGGMLKLTKATIPTTVPRSSLAKSNNIFWCCSALTEVWYGDENIVSEVI